MNKHYSDLDGMRGILSCFVMKFHFGLNTIVHDLSGGFINGGLWDLCVDFFFVLSGFVLAQSFLRKRPTFGQYLFRRIKRLVPLYLFSIALILVVAPGFDWHVVLANVLLVQPFVRLPSVNFPSWSIPFELYLPALAVTGLALFSRRAGLTLLVLSVFIGSIALVQLASGHNMQLLRALCGLTAGFALFSLRDRLNYQPKNAETLALFAAVVGVIVIVYHVPFMAVLYLPLVCVLVLFGSYTVTILSSPPIRALGRWSYGIYLLHIPTLLIGEALFSPERMSGAAAKVGLIVATIIFAAIAHHLIEKPFMARRKTDAGAETLPVSPT